MSCQTWALGEGIAWGAFWLGTAAVIIAWLKYRAKDFE